MERKRRKTRQGVVLSRSGDKTCVVLVEERKQHAMYGKTVTRSSKLHCHDGENVTNVGDMVLIAETRPLSRRKRWRLVEVVEAAK